MKQLKNASSIRLLFFLFINASLISCQSKVDEAILSRLIDKNLLIEDLEYLIENVEKRHVDFYERANPDSILRMKHVLRSLINRDMDRTEFFRIIAQFNPYFNDAHCLVFPLREEASIKKKNGSPLFPFHVILDEHGKLRPERSYERDSDGSLIDKSWEITAINGVAASDILDSIERYSHGETAGLRRHMTTLLFSDWLFSIFGWSGDFELTFSNENKTLIVNSSDFWKSLEVNVVQYNRLEIMEHNMGYLRLGSFDVDEHKNQYQDFIEASFDSLAKLGVKKLIIDVRGNTGGQSEAGELVLRYLADKELSQVSQMFDRIHEDNSGLLNYRGKPGDLKELKVGSSELITPHKPEKQFKGDVLVLFDEMTYSAGIIFITIVQDHKLAQTLGRPTGGYANQTGNIEPFQLPHSKLTVYAPSRKFVRVNGNSRIHSVVPDIIINTLDTLSITNDKVLEYGLNLLRN